MENNIDASAFAPSFAIYRLTLAKILSAIGICCADMTANGDLVENDEERIRDHIHQSYLIIPAWRTKLKIADFTFECEPKEFGVRSGYLDLKVNSLNTFDNPAAYYAIECKRISHKNCRRKSGLNGLYIKKGVLRFVTKQYSSYHRVSGMIGFVVDDYPTDAIVLDIGNLLQRFPEANTIQTISKEPNNTELYLSDHNDTDSRSFRILHIFPDIAKSIISN